MEMCRSCRHFEKWEVPDSPFGQCRMISAWEGLEEPPGSFPQTDQAFVIAPGGADTGFLIVAADFGCVLHEP